MKKAFVKVVSFVCAILSVLVFASAVEINSFSENLTVYYNNENVYENAVNKPYIINDRTMVPLKPIFEAMGWEEENISFDETTKTAVFRSEEASCEFVNESNVAVKYYNNGEKESFVLDVPATIYNGNFYIPLRAFCNIWETEIVWEDATRSVYIMSTNVEEPEIPEIEEPAETPEELPAEVPSETADLTEDEAIAFVENIVGADMSLYCEYSFQYEGEKYYQISVSAVIVDDLESGESHTSKVTNYIVAADGSKAFEGYYNQEAGELTNYEEDEENMSQE